MIAPSTLRMADSVLTAVAVLVNILMVGIMLSRVPGLKRVERILGWVFLTLALPVIAALILNALAQREWWAIVLPLLLALFMAVEFVLDYLLELNFRETRLLWPYLLLYYVSLWGMIGYVFLVSRSWGFVNLALYFLNLLATWFSYSKVRHGGIGNTVEGMEGHIA